RRRGGRGPLSRRRRPPASRARGRAAPAPAAEPPSRLIAWIVVGGQVTRRSASLCLAPFGAMLSYNAPWNPSGGSPVEMPADEQTRCLSRARVWPKEGSVRRIVLAAVLSLIALTPAAGEVRIMATPGPHLPQSLNPLAPLRQSPH